MKNLKRMVWLSYAGLMITFLPVVLKAQNSVSLSISNNVAMTFIPPIRTGNPFEPVTDNSKWLNYNITVTPPAPTVSITARIESGMIPQGVEIQIQAGSYQGSGGGSPGIPAGLITLSSIPQVIISNIGTCNTGSGPNVGHQLTYRMNITNYSAAQASFANLNLLFAIVIQ